MTIFTKPDATEEKKNEKETTQPEAVVVTPNSLSPTGSPPPTDEGNINNCGWVPMGGGNFDRPKEKRSSSFGPLSIIRLSPSPLARTPSPSPPEYENAQNERRYRRYARFMIGFCILISVALSFALFFYQKGLINSAYKRGVYHGWNAASYNSHGVPQRLEQNVEINPEEAYEKIDVPRFGSNRPAIFLHDFKMNLTAIVDVLGKRCFLKPLDKGTVAPPKSLIDMLKGMDASTAGQASPRVVREVFRVGPPMSEPEVAQLGFLINRHCAYRPTYMLQKASTTEEVNKRVRRDIDAMEQLEFVSMGGDSVEEDTIVF